MKMINYLRDIYGFPHAAPGPVRRRNSRASSMAAIGTKDLQTAAYLKLGKMALAIQNEEGPTLSAIKAARRAQQQQPQDAFVSSKVLETNHRLMTCQRKLARMQVKHRHVTFHCMPGCFAG